MKPIVTKCKSVRGRVVGHTATLGPVTSAQKPTPADASAQCEADTFAALRRLDRGTRVFRWREHMIVVSPTIHGWDYWIDTFSHTDYTISLSCATREDAEDAALGQLAQHLWTLDVTDDETFTEGLAVKVRAELKSWIKFQRGYARARASGMNDQEAHRAAGDAP